MWEQVVLEHRNGLLQLTRQFVSQAEGFDIVQEVFIKAYQKIDTFRAEASLKTWLYRICYNECLMTIRKAKTASEDFENLTDSDFISTDDALQLLSEEQRGDIIQGALAKLSAGDAAILTLFYLEELSIKEVGIILEKSESAVKVHLHRARARMLKKLDAFLQNEKI